MPSRAIQLGDVDFSIRFIYCQQYRLFCSPSGPLDCTDCTERQNVNKGRFFWNYNLKVHSRSTFNRDMGKAIQRFVMCYTASFGACYNDKSYHPFPPDSSVATFNHGKVTGLESVNFINSSAHNMDLKSKLVR